MFEGPAMAPAFCAYLALMSNLPTWYIFQFCESMAQLQIFRAFKKNKDKICAADMK